MSSELTRRIAFGVIAAPIAIVILLYGGAPLAALLAIVSALGASEFFRIARADGLTPFDNVGTAIAGIIPLVVHARFQGIYNAEGSVGPLSLIAVALLVLLGLSIWMRGVNGKPLSAVAVTALGAAVHRWHAQRAYAICYHAYAFAPAVFVIGGRTFNVPGGGLLCFFRFLRRGRRISGRIASAGRSDGTS